jgi:hypothetical protein
MLRKFISAVALSLLLLPLVAQDDIQWLGPDRKLSRWIASGYMDWGIAGHLFAQNMEENHGFGPGGEVLFNIQRRRPIWVGAGVHSFAFDDFRLTYMQEFDGILYTYEDHTVSRIFMAHGVIRFQPEVRFVLQPYIQGALGIHWFYTNTKVKDLDLAETVERINDNRAAVPGFTMHAGVQFVPRKLPDVRADLRVGYFRNASVEYLRYNPRTGGGSFPIDYFEARTSPVDMIGINIGVPAVIRAE